MSLLLPWLLTSFLIDAERYLKCDASRDQMAWLPVTCGTSWRLSPSRPLRLAMRRNGVNLPKIPGTADSSLGALRSLFESAGFKEIETTSIEVSQQFVSFEEFWQAQTSNYTPTTKMITAMAARDRMKLIKTVRAELPTHQNAAIQYLVRANAIRARVPDKL